MTVGPTPQGRAAEVAPRGAVRSAVRTHHHRTGWRTLGAVLLAALLAVMLLGAVACGGEPESSASAEPSQLTVFAAASLTDSFTELGSDFTAAHPGVAVVFSFAASSDLAAQIQDGAPADVYASADTINMDKAGDLVNTPQIFATNALTIAVAPGNPEHITGLADLARKDLKVVLAAPEVPVGNYANEILDRAGVAVKPVSLEANVKGVVTKVALGEADAGIVYVTDVSAAKGDIDGVDIPESQNLIASYPIATVVASKSPENAQAFVDFVLSDAGQQVLASYGFLPPPGQ